MKQRLVPQPRQKKRLVALRSHHCQQETACCQDIKTQRICRENKNMYDKQYICCWFRLVLFLFKKKNYILLKIILCVWLFFTLLKQLSKTWCQGMLGEVGKWGGSTFSGFGVLFIHSDWFLRYSGSRNQQRNLKRSWGTPIFFFTNCSSPTIKLFIWKQNWHNMQSLSMACLHTPTTKRPNA